MKPMMRSVSLLVLMAQKGPVLAPKRVLDMISTVIGIRCVEVGMEWMPEDRVVETWVVYEHKGEEVTASIKTPDCPTTDEMKKLYQTIQVAAEISRGIDMSDTVIEILNEFGKKLPEVL